MKKILVGLLCLLLTTPLFSQSLSNYLFTPEAGTYVHMTGGTQLLAGGADTQTSPLSPIGFEFWYMGNRYTQFKVTDNGILAFGNPTLPSTNGNSLNTSGARPVLAPLWDDMAVWDEGNVSYLVAGSAPNRVLTVQWDTMQWNWNSGDQVISFQVKLFEKTGVIEYHYRQENNPPSGGTASIGMNATATGANNFLSLNGAGPNPAVSYTTETTTISVRPATGQIYRFTPPNPTLDPSGLTTSCIKNNEITLNWTNATDPKRVRTAIYQSTDDVTYTYVGMVNAGVESYTATGLTTNTLYYFRIVSVSEGYVGNTLSTSHATQGAVINASNTSVCQGSTVDLTGTGFFGTISAWQSSVDNVNWTTIPGATGASYTSDPLTASTYFRYVIDSDGCTTNSPSVQVVVSPQGGTAITSASPVCLGSTANLSLTGSTGTVQWQSSFDDVTYGNITGATSNPYTTAPINQITYYRAILSDGACPDATSSTVMVAVDSIPVFTSGINGPKYPCVVTSVTYNVAPISNATGYTWTVPNGYTVTAGAGTNQITVLLGPLAGAGNVTVTATNACGTTTAMTLSVTPVTAAPATPGTITGNATACEGATEIYSIAPVNNTNFYTWTVPAGSTINSGDSTIQIETTFGSTSGNITVTATNGCGTSAASTKAITLTPNVTPAISIAITNGSNPSCDGASVTYTASPTNGGTSPSYAWFVNNIQVATTPDYTTDTLVDGDQIYCELTSNLPCVTQSMATSNVETHTVFQNVIPTISIANLTAMPVCEGDTIQFSSSVTNEGTAPVYDWQVNGVSSGSMATFESTQLNNGDTVVCYLTTNNTCALPNPAISDTIFIQENALPSASITGDTTLCQGESQTLNIQLTGLAPYTLYIESNGVADTLSGIVANSYDTLISTVGTYKILKVMDGNCSAVNADSIQVEQTTTVQIINVNEQCSADGTSYVVSFDLTGGDTTTYAVTGNSGTLTGSTFVSDTLATGTSYQFIADDQYSCSADTISNTVNCPCITDGTISGDTTFCSGDSTYLHFDFTGIAPFTFVIDNGTSIDTLMTNSMSYDTLVFNSGVYYLTEVMNAYCNVMLNDSAVVSFFTTPNFVNLTTSCDYSTMTYTVSFDLAGGDTATYMLTGSTGTLTGTSFVSDPIPAGMSYTFSVSDANACDTATISDVVTCPCQTSGTISGDTTICSGDSTYLHFDFTGIAPITFVIDNGTSIDTLTVNALSYDTLVFNAGTYYLTEVYDAYCDSIFLDSAVVSFHTSPMITNLTTSCDYSTMTYTVSFDLVDGDSTSYAVAGNTGTLSGASFVSDPIQSGTGYTFTVSDANACSTTTIADTVTCVCPADAQISGGGTICQGDSVAINFVFAGIAPWTVSYTSGNSDTYNFQASSDTTIYVSTGGTYTLISVMDANCVGTTSGSAIVVVNTTATPVISENNLVLTSSATTGNQWYMNGAILVGETNQTYTVTQNGTYSVVVTENGCESDTSNLIVVNNVSVEELDLTGSVFVMPNPTSGNFEVQYPKNVGFQYFELRDLSGRLIANQTENSFDISELPAGTYILGIYFENQQVFKKVVKK